MFTTELQVQDYPGSRLRLIKPSLKHAGLSLGWLTDSEVGQHMGADFSEVSMETEKKRVRDLLDNDDRISWMIELDGQVIGNIEINSIKETSEAYGVKAGKFSTLIGEKQHWGKHIAPYAKKRVMNWAFHDHGFDLFIGKVLPDNERSWKSLERLGFELRETKSETENGSTHQWRIYAMTKEHWLKPTAPRR